MRSTDFVTPITSSNWDDVLLRNLETSLDGKLNFLGNLDTNSNMSVLITNSDDSLESGSLTGLGLLLNGDDLDDLIIEILQEFLSDLVFLDWDGVKEDLLDRLDLASLNKSAKLGHGHPFLVVTASAATSGATTTTTTSAAPAHASSEATSIFSSYGISLGLGLVRLNS